MKSRATETQNFWDIPLDRLLHEIKSTPQGLSSQEAKARLDIYGSNTLVHQVKFSPLYELIRLFLNP
jgi:Mg2+-importing ATPase